MSKEVEVFNVTDSTALSTALMESLSSDVDSESSDSNKEINAEPDNSEEQESSTTHETTVVCEDTEGLLFFENQNVTRSMPFDPENPDGDEGFPIEGRGSIDNILVQAQTDNFSVFLRVDDDDIIDEKDFSYLESLSQELSNISAYERTNGDFILSITDYPFKEEVKFALSPKQQTTFDLIRAEAVIKSQ